MLFTGVLCKWCSGMLLVSITMLLNVDSSLLVKSSYVGELLLSCKTLNNICISIVFDVLVNYVLHIHVNNELITGHDF